MINFVFVTIINKNKNEKQKPAGGAALILVKDEVMDNTRSKQYFFININPA